MLHKFVALGLTLAVSLAGRQFSPSLGKVQITSLALDTHGNTYVTGSIASSDLPTTPNAFQPSYHATTCPSLEVFVIPCRDAFLAKFDASGALVFATYLGGSGDDAANSVAVDGQGNAYVVGFTKSSDFPITPNALSGTNGPGVFVTKVNASGTGLIYSTILPGAGAANAVGVDASGNAYIAGATADPNFPVTTGALQVRFGGGSLYGDGFLCKLNAAGTALIYATYLGGSGADVITGLAVDTSGGAYVTGQSTSLDFPITPGAVDTRPTGKSYYWDAFVARINATGSHLVYAARLAGSLNDEPTSIAINSTGNAFITGETQSTDYPRTSGAYLPPIGPIGGAFVTVLTSDGTALVYSTSSGGGSGNGIFVDTAGDAFVTGATVGGGLPTTAEAPERCNPLGASQLYQGFLSELDRQGAHLLFGSYLDTPGSSGIAIAVRPSGSVIVAIAASQDFVTEIDPSVRRPFGVDCVANSANFVPGTVAPGELVTIYGSQIGPTDGASAEVSEGRIGTLLAGTHVSFDGIPATVLYTREDQVNAVVPFEIAGRASATLQVEYQGQLATALQLAVQDAVPGIFRLGGTNLAAVLNQDSTLNTPANPAPRGSIVTIFATGGGAMNPAVSDGSIADAPPFSTVSAPVSVYFYGWQGDVLYAGSSPGMVAGTLQINARVPADMLASGPSVDLTLKVGETEFPNWVTIAVK